jgi:hypothetical protein
MVTFPHDSIGAMRDGDFWARPDSLGLSETDLAFVEGDPSDCPPDALERIRIACFRAAERLNDAEEEANLSWGKPS